MKLALAVFLALLVFFLPAALKAPIHHLQEHHFKLAITLFLLWRLVLVTLLLAPVAALIYFLLTLL